MYYIQMTSNNKMMTINGWMTIDQKETKNNALEIMEDMQKSLNYKHSGAKLRVIAQRDWRKEIFGA